MAIPDYLRKTIVVFDTETAVLHDHVCEIGFSIFNNCTLTREVGTFVKPIIPISEGSEAIHHISNVDVASAPTFVQLSTWIYDLLNTADYHCAYNYDYDRLVLGLEFGRVGMRFPVKPMFDPMLLFRKWNKWNKGKKLTDAAEKYGIQLTGAHRATNDATATGNLLFKMAAVRNDFPKSITKFLELQRHLVQHQYEDFASYYEKIGKPTPEPPNYSNYEVPGVG